MTQNVKHGFDQSVAYGEKAYQMALNNIYSAYVFFLSCKTC